MSDQAPSRSNKPIATVPDAETDAMARVISTSPKSFTPSSPPRSAPLSRLPPKASAHRLAAQLLHSDDLLFLDVLKQAGLIRDLDEDELLRIATAVPDAEGLERRIDLLEAYYEAGGNLALARTRSRQDRFFLQHVSEPVTTTALITQLGDVAPELGEIVLERIGMGDDGPLILRSGEHIVALIDDDDDDETGPATITLRGLVHAVNVLFDRHGVRERMVSLLSDETREVYLATTITEAIELTRGGWLEDESVEDVMELGGW